LNRAATRVLSLWDKGAVLSRIDDASPATFVGRSDSFTALDVSPEGRFAATGTLNGIVELWDLARGTATKLTRDVNLIAILQFNAAGTRLLTVSFANADKPAAQVTVLDITTGRQLWRTSGSFTAASWDPKGTSVAVADEQNAVWLWSAETGKPSGGPFRCSAPVLDVRFSDDGSRLLAVSSDHRAWSWDVRTRTQITTSAAAAPGERAIGGKLSPDGSRFVTATGTRATIRDTATGAPSGAPLEHESRIHFIVFSPDGRRIATSSRDGTARIWDASSGRPLGEPLRHEEEVGYLKFSPDGRRLATSTITGAVRVWDVRTGLELIDPQHHDKTVFGLGFTPDGNRVTSVSEDGTLRVWDIAPSVPPPSWLPELAAAISQRRLDGGTVVTLDPQIELLDRLRRQFSIGDDEWTVWGRWLLADPAMRAPSPFQRR
jgi:WD40 repeat protein